MTGWRCAAILGNAEAIAQLWRLKSNVDSGQFEEIQLARAAAGVEVSRPKGTISVWAPIPEGYENAAAYCEHVLEEAAVVISPGGAYGPNGEGFFRISLTTPDDRLEEGVARLSRL